MYVHISARTSKSCDHIVCKSVTKLSVYIKFCFVNKNFSDMALKRVHGKPGRLELSGSARIDKFLRMWSHESNRITDNSRLLAY